MLGHELAHVVQQRAGRVQGTQAMGLPVNLDENLEREADRAGADAAHGRKVRMPQGGREPTGFAPDPSVQGIWQYVVGELAKGVAQGVLTEAGKDEIRRRAAEAIGAAAPLIEGAIAEAMKNGEVAAQLNRLADLAGIKEAALNMARAHAKAIGDELMAKLKDIMPDMPDLVPTIVREIQEAMVERLHDAYLYRFVAMAREMMSEFAFAAIYRGIIEYGGLRAQEMLEAMGVGLIRDTAKAVAAPILAGADKVAETAKAAQELVDQMGITRNPLRKAGKALGKYGYEKGVEQLGTVAPTGEELLGSLQDTAEQSTESATQSFRERLGSAGKVDPAEAYKAAMAIHHFAEAESTEDRLNALAVPAFELGVAAAATSVGAMAAPVIFAAVPALAGVTFAPVLVPAMAAAGFSAVALRYGTPVVTSVVSSAAPYVEAAGQLPVVGTPIRKGAQAVHMTASAVNLGLVLLTAGIPYVGGGWEGINRANEAASCSTMALMGSLPEEEEAPAETASREVATESGISQRDRTSPLGASPFAMMGGMPMMGAMGMPMMGASSMFAMRMAMMGMPPMSPAMFMAAAQQEGELNDDMPELEEDLPELEEDTPTVSAGPDPVYLELVRRLEALRGAPAAPLEEAELCSNCSKRPRA